MSEPGDPSATKRALTIAEIRSLIQEGLRPGHFFVDPNLGLEWRYHAQLATSWEIFQGRLLDPAHTRLRQAFETWEVGVPGASEPLLAVRLDSARGLVHVTRAIECYAWQGYHAGDNVYLSRETRKWVSELVGTIRWDELLAAELRDELICLIFQAVVGTSRLPLTSVESPLPAFSLGQLAYCYRSELAADSATAPVTSWHALVDKASRADLARREQVKLLEVLLRAAPLEELDEAAACWLEARSRLGQAPATIPGLLRSLFDEVALSPDTGFVPKTLAFLDHLSRRGALPVADHVDFLGYLLHQLGRHLTAYDLITFHHRGANYPDALLLDAVLQRYLASISQHPELFMPDVDQDPAVQERSRLRRRGLRQAWLIRRRYEGHPVPDVPTSPGENARVLPPPHVRVSEEQITDPARRTKRLFAGQPLPPANGAIGTVLRHSVDDLQHPDELRELGMAIYLDRPLGSGKRPGEPDATPLLSYEAFSRTVALDRLRQLHDHCGLLRAAAEYNAHAERLQKLAVHGLGVGSVISSAIPGRVSVDDAARAAPDFLFLRTTRGSARDFVLRFDWSTLAQHVSLDFLAGRENVLIIRASGDARDRTGRIDVYDALLRLCLQLRVNQAGGYSARAGVEYPTDGLEALRAWSDRSECVLVEQTLAAGVQVPPRRD
jgi:hypothetical protein